MALKAMASNHAEVDKLEKKLDDFIQHTNNRLDGISARLKALEALEANKKLLA